MNNKVFKILLSIVSGIVLGLYLSSVAIYIYIFLIIVIKFLKCSSLCKCKENCWVYFLISILFFSISYLTNLKYETLYVEEIQYTGIAEVVSFAEEKDYTNKNIIKIKSLYVSEGSEKIFSSNSILNSINNYKNYFFQNAKNTKLIIYVDKEYDLEYGDIISFTGSFEKASGQKNDKGFDYERYLRQSEIYGILDIENIEILKEGSGVVHGFFKFRNNLKEKLYEIYDEEKAGFLAGILLRR